MCDACGAWNALYLLVGDFAKFRLTYTVEEAAALVGVARSTMYELVRSGEVGSVRVGRRVFVTAPTIEALTGVTPPSPADLAVRRSTTEPEPERSEPAESARPLDPVAASSASSPARRAASTRSQPTERQRCLFG